MTVNQKVVGSNPSRNAIQHTVNINAVLFARECAESKVQTEMERTEVLESTRWKYVVYLMKLIVRIEISEVRSCCETPPNIFQYSTIGSYASFVMKMFSVRVRILDLYYLDSLLTN